MNLLTSNPAAVAILTHRFPGVPLWFGEATRSWWALARVSWGWRLVEAADVEELTRAIIQADTWPRPPVHPRQTVRYLARGFHLPPDAESTRADLPALRWP
ncbi:hypothetical protein GCM10023196_002200 [Actinoallomurus vinaceus]|uniref:Uncharacterized protein n=1 Tax=Actinoallomurus vinaceus TaxID=1080074 RepID=A0ABP8TZ22_9ACTN